MKTLCQSKIESTNKQWSKITNVVANKHILCFKLMSTEVLFMIQLTFQLPTLHTWTVFKASASAEVSAPSVFTFTHSLLLSVLMLFSFSIHKLVLSSFKNSTSRFTPSSLHHLRFTATGSSTSHWNWCVSFTQRFILNWNFNSFQLFESLTAASVLSGFSILTATSITTSNVNFSFTAELFLVNIFHLICLIGYIQI